MRLDQELVKRGLCESRTEAQELIEQGKVFVNGTICTKQTRQVLETDLLEVTARRAYVSRGGEKLEGALLDVFGSEEKITESFGGKRALDVGSSTGGFTDCLLTFGVQHVDAVDVGTAQLHPRLRADARVSMYENTDIRNFQSDVAYGIIVADLSFISLEQVLARIVSFAQTGTFISLLIKPQFEVGRGNTKKGIVKDQSLVTSLLAKYEMMVRESGLIEVMLFPCRIQGGDGNQEYFLVGTKK